MKELSPGRWRFRVYLGRDSQGRERYASRYFHGSKRQAEDALRAFLSDIGVGFQDATNATVGDLARHWLKVKAEPNYSPSTVEEYRRLIDKIIVPELGSTKLRAVRPANLDALYADLRKRLSPASVHHVHSLLRAIFNQGIRWGWMTVNPATRASPPTVRRKHLELPDPETVAALIGQLEARSPELALLLRLAALTGLRRGELAGLQWRDLDSLRGTLTVSRSVVGRSNSSLTLKQPKTGTGRTIALDRETVDALLTHRNQLDERAAEVGAEITDSAFVFSPDIANRQPWRPDGLSLALRRARNHFQAEGISWLALRHWAATRLLVSGVDVRTVSARLGHASPVVTLSRYAEFVRSADQAAAEKIAAVLAGETEEGGVASSHGEGS